MKHGAWLVLSMLRRLRVEGVADGGGNGGKQGGQKRCMKHGRRQLPPCFVMG